MKLNYGKTFLLGFGFLAVSVIWSIYNAFVPVVLAQRFHLDARWVAFFVTLDNVAALLIQPPVGAWSDKLRTPWGRRLPFILIGAPISALAFAALPVASALPIFVMCSSTLLVSMAFWRTPVIALVADVTPSPFRSQASGIISLMGGVGAIIAYFGGSILTSVNPAFPFWLGSVVVTIAALCLFLWVKEPKSHAAAAVEVSEAVPGFWAGLWAVLQSPDRSLLCLLISVFFLMLGYSAIEVFFTLYALHHLGLDSSASTRLLGQMSLVFVVFALPSGLLGARLGRRHVMMTGIALMAGVLLVIHALPVATLTHTVLTLPLFGSVPVVGLLLMLIGIAWTLIIIHPLPMLSDMTDESRLGAHTGIYYLFTSLAGILGPNANGWIVQRCGGDYNAVMLFAPVALAIAWGFLWGVKQGEAAEEIDVGAKANAAPEAAPGAACLA